MGAVYNAAVELLRRGPGNAILGLWARCTRPPLRRPCRREM